MCNCILHLLPVLVQHYEELGWFRSDKTHSHIWIIRKTTSEVTNLCLLPLCWAASAAKKQIWQWEPSSSLQEFYPADFWSFASTRSKSVQAAFTAVSVICGNSGGREWLEWSCKKAAPAEHWCWRPVLCNPPSTIPMFSFPSFTGNGEGWITWGFSGQL